MKVNSLLAILSNFESAVTVAAGSAPPIFTTFGRSFVGHDEKDVLPLVKSLIKQRDIHGRGSNTPPIAKLREALTQIEACLRNAGAKKAADDLGKLVELLEGCWQANVEALVSDAREWLLEANAKKKRGNSRGSRQGAPEPSLSPADYAALLKRSAKENAQFDQVVAQLRGDHKIKTADMREIALQFLGYELAKKKGRKLALTEIIQRQAMEARQDGRGSLLDRSKPW